MITRRNFLKTTLIATLASQFISEKSDAVYFGPDEKKYEFNLCVSDKKNLTESYEWEKNREEKRILSVYLSPYNLSENQEPVKLDYYLAEKKTPIIILPILGGASGGIEGSVAKYYQKKGFPSMIINIDQKHDVIKKVVEEATSEKDVKRFAEEFNRIYKAGPLSISRTIDWIEKKDKLDYEELNQLGLKKEDFEFDNNNIGAVGISLGGIVLSSYLGMHDKLKAAIPCLAGCNFPKIVANSQEPGITKEREKILSKLGRDEKWLEKNLEGKFDFDPIDHAYNIPPRDKNIRIYLVKNDGYVPIETGHELAKAMGNPEVILLENKGFKVMVAKLLLSLPGLNKYKDPHTIVGLSKKNKIIKESAEFFEERLSA